MAQNFIDHQELTFNRDFFRCCQKTGKDDAVYASNLQHLAECTFHGLPPNRVANSVVAQFRDRVQLLIIIENLYVIKINKLNIFHFPCWKRLTILDEVLIGLKGRLFRFASITPTLLYARFGYAALRQPVILHTGFLYSTLRMLCHDNADV
ncbi:unnamed protein product [Taenia asiatica]|uniref:Uncharacterized protein n=1 Tax=Taenia asiatica TaxID=60517 RepID=A0A0R3W1N9_TAEAS|nr:unnamed protein product [Taenia asiatica]